MHLPQRGSAHRAKLVGLVVGAAALVVVAVLALLKVDTTGVFSKANFELVEGFAQDFEAHKSSGRWPKASLSFSLRGQEVRLFSEAVNGVHPSWLEKPAFIRTYVPSDKRRWRIGPYGVHTYGLCVNGVEQLSLENGVRQSARSAYLAVFVALVCAATSVACALAAYRIVANNEG